MEDPMRFAVWATLRRGHTNDAVAWLFALRPDLTEIDVRKRVNRSALQSEWICVLRSASWHQADALRREPPPWCDSMRLCQEGWEPDSESSAFCERHQFYYGGCLDCHVCSGFYQP